MTGNSVYTAQANLNWMLGRQAAPALPSVYMALFTAVGDDTGTGMVEPTGNGYARTQVAGNAATNNTTASGNATLHFAATPVWIVAGMYVFDITTGGVIPSGAKVLSTTGTTVVMDTNAAGGGVGNGDTIVFSAFSAPTSASPSTSNNTAAIIFPLIGPGDWGTIIAFGLYDDPSAGNFLAWDYIGAYNWLPCTIAIGAPGVVTSSAHGYAVNDSVVFTTEYGGSSPLFSSGNLTGILTITAPVTLDTFTLKNAGNPVNVSSAGDGQIRKITPFLALAGNQPRFLGGTPGALQVSNA